jgi:amphi-Trp domain-containing protein
VSDLELGRKESLSRAEAAKRLSAFAEALAAGGEGRAGSGRDVASLRVADDVRTEFEVEVKGDQIEVEMELTWSMTPGSDGRKADGRKV